MATIKNTLVPDNAYGTIASGLAVGDTTLAFTTGHGARFPVVTSGQALYCCLLNSGNVLEEIKITAHTSGSDSATMVRGVGGTTAKVWSAGDRIEMRLSSAVLAGIASNIVNFEDYGAVGDGVTDDAAAWTLAFAGIGSSNAEIRGISGKTYLIGAAGVNIASKTNVRVVGNGAKIKLNAAAVQTLQAFGSTAIKFTSCVDCYISGFEVDGNAKASNLIGLDTCTDCEISGNSLTNGGVNGLIVSAGGTRNRILRNTAYSAIGSSRGIWIGNYSAAEMEADILVEGNAAYSNPATGIVVSSVGGRVVGNHAVGNSGSGIIYGGASGFASKSLAITGNLCRSNTFHGIQADVTYSTTADLPVGIAITGNVCELNFGSGIYHVYVNGGSIAGNVCINNNSDAVSSGHGISCDEVSEIAITGNYCCDTRAGGARTQGNGIDIVVGIGTNNVKNVTISGNICRNNTANGIFAQQNSTFTISGLSIIGNQCNDNATRGIFVNEGGTAGNITRCVIVGNACNNNGTVDIRASNLDAAISDNLYTTEQGVSTFQFTDLDTTPSVKGARKLFKAANSGATAVTAFDDGVIGQQIEVWFSTANTTINSGGNFLLKGGLNLAPVAANSIIRFVQTAANFWTENGRNF